MLTEVARQILHAPPEIGKELDAGILQIESARGEVARQRVGRVGVLETVHRAGEPVDLRLAESQRLARLPRRAAAPIRDDIGRHAGAQLSVSLMRTALNDLLPAIAARQIQIDVGPLSPLFREKPLEEQIHPDRIDGRNSQAVADSAVGCRPAALHEDVVLPAEVHDVPHDEEVAGEIEFSDEIELARNLCAGAIVIRTIAVARADVGHRPQERLHRFARRHRIFRKAIAEIRHRELQSIGQCVGGRQQMRPIAKERRHLGGRLEIPFGIRCEPAAGGLERHAMMDARQHVEDGPLLRHRETNTVGCHDRHVVRRGQIRQQLVVGLFITQAVALQLDEDAIAPNTPTIRSSSPPTP